MNTADPQPEHIKKPIACRLAVSATFTADPVKDAMAFWMEELGLVCAIEFAPYNQVFQQLLDAGSRLAQNRHGVNIVLVRIEDWQRSLSRSTSREKIGEHLARTATELIGAI